MLQKCIPRRMMSTEKSNFRKHFPRTMDSEGMILKNSQSMMGFDYEALTKRIRDGTYSVRRPHFKPMTKSCVFDFATFALERPGFRLLQTICVASSYGAYYYLFTNLFLPAGLVCGAISGITAFACANAVMLRRINIASMTVLPDGESVRLVTFRGSVHDALISEFELVGIRPKNLRIVYKTNGKVQTVQIDQDSRFEKEDNDLELIFAISHPEVKRIDFQL